MFTRIWAIIKKEFISIINMKVIIAIVFVAPVLQTVIFGYAAVIESKNIPIAVIDRDFSATSREFRQTLENCGYFILIDDNLKESDIDRYFKLGKISGCIIIPSKFEQRLKKYGSSDIQVNIDGSDSTVANAVSGYINSACASFSSVSNSVSIETRLLFNPTGENKFFFIPGVFGMILMIIGMPLTAISLVKEKEEGTFEQLNVTPIQSYELLIGKIIPYMFLIFISSTLMLVISLLVFHLPLRGNIFVLYLDIFIFFFVALGLGIFVSIISATQQQAMLTSFLILLPTMLFSGFMFPVENMTGIFRIIANINPFYHFLKIMRDVFLKGSPLEYLKPNFISIFLADIVVFFTSVSLFSKRSS